MSKSNLPEELKNFSSLPDCAYVRQPVIKALLGVSDATIWRMVNRGDLPKPRKLSERVTGWNVGELRTILSGEKA